MNAKSAAPATTKPNAEYAIYKPNGRGNGGVIRFEFNRTKGAVFVDATTQSGEKQFDWESKITMKWGLNDLGSVLATLQGRQEQAKLFHQSEKANSAFELTYPRRSAESTVLHEHVPPGRRDEEREESHHPRHAR
jgi:hypothetical protein